MNASSPLHLPPDHAARMQRAFASLEGLSVADALGAQFFNRFNEHLVQLRVMPAAPWKFTDDTAMALSICETLNQLGKIDQEDLARRFAARFMENPDRGYGGTAQRILTDMAEGMPWRDAARSVFEGHGSMGNGSAMRVGPVGAYFADDYAAAALHASLSAEVTHTHPEGLAGAVAVAVAAAAAWQERQQSPAMAAVRLFEGVLAHTPSSRTREGIVLAADLDKNTPVPLAVKKLGNGRKVIASDTVPFTLWAAARSLDNYEEAIWSTYAGGGDIDTNGAIVGSIVTLYTGRQSIPIDWLKNREKLPTGFQPLA